MKIAAKEEAKPAAKRPTEEDVSDLDSDDDSEDDDSEAKKLKAGGRGGDLSRLRREKRLAMNRESARARRKRKKVLLETLEQQVADLAKRNQRFQLANETLSAKVHQLESELSVARSTITLLSQQSNPTPQLGNFNFSRDAGGPQDAIRRFLASQSLPLAEHGGPSRGLQSQMLSEEALLRQQSMLEYQALAARAGRDPGMAGLLDRLGPLGRQQLASNPTPAGLHPTSIKNTVSTKLRSSCRLPVCIILNPHRVLRLQLAMPSELAFEAGRLSDNYSRLSGMSMDAISPSASAVSSQMISELLKQQQQRQAGKYSPQSKP